MYYDIDRILREELEAVRYLLSRMDDLLDEASEEVLELKPTKQELIYHRRESRENAEGVKKKQSEKIGNERHPRVIAIKQAHYNRQLKNHLEKAKAFLERNIGKYEGYDIDTIDAKLHAVYRDTTGLVNKDPILMSNEEWSRKPYIRNSYPLDKSSNIACDGQPVRSKGEVILYDQLVFLGIPFWCDAEVHLRDETGAVIRKDADVLIGTVHGKKPIVEHLGMILDDEYLEKSWKKIQLYVRNGYTLNETLFITADDRDNKTNAYAMMQLLKKMILPKVHGKK